jgi:hypothetical protein
MRRVTATDRIEAIVRQAQQRSRSKQAAPAGAPTGPQIIRDRPTDPTPAPPWALLGAAVGAGYLLAKAIDWRA